MPIGLSSGNKRGFAKIVRLSPTRQLNDTTNLDSFPKMSNSQTEIMSPTLTNLKDLTFLSNRFTG
jgi:hypothetical protein